MKAKKKILVVGDVIFDHYTYVTSNRFCQEAPTQPIYDILKSECRLGGAANVASNIAALGENEVDVYLSGIFHTNNISMIQEANIIPYYCFHNEELTKNRFVNLATNTFIMRVDNRKRFEQDTIEKFSRHFVDIAALNTKQFDAIVISDYDKGSADYIASAILQDANCLVIVDSKRKDLSIFAGADFLNINEEEYVAQVSNSKYTNVESLFGHVVVTCGEAGAQLRIHENGKKTGEYITHVENFRTTKVNVADVTGCGDTHTAALAIGLLRNKNDIRNAVRFATQCATIAVQKFGTSRITKWDYLKSLEK